MLLVVELLDGRELDEGGRRHEDVQAAEAIDRILHEPVVGGGLGEVGDEALVGQAFRLGYGEGLVRGRSG